MAPRTFGRHPALGPLSIIAPLAALAAVASAVDENWLRTVQFGLGAVFLTLSILKVRGSAYLTLDQEGLRVHEAALRLTLWSDPDERPRLIRWQELQAVEKAGPSAVILGTPAERVRLSLDPLGYKERREALAALDAFTAQASGRGALD